MKGHTSLPKLIGFFAAMAVALPLAGCDSGISITYENQTRSTIYIDVRSSEDEQRVFDEVEAGLTRTFDYLADDRYEITVITGNGRLLFLEVFTEDELEEIGNRIIIDSTLDPRFK